jgi:hypothetical protein
MDKRYITGSTVTGVGEIPQVSTDLTRADRWGSWKARWSIGRMDYTVAPGLYAVGNPDEDSPVFVSANYKLSFDALRSELKGLDAWTMVLDTKGINVWCAAGKGTFGTQELVNRIKHTRLGEIVGHRRLVVPQLGAPGVAAHEVRDISGFSVTYGPVRAPDIKPFLEAGMVATSDMRRVSFSASDRLRLVPVELIGGLKYLLFAGAMFFLLAGLHRGGYSTSLSSTAGLRSMLNLVLAYLGGVVVGPVMLPWLPGRSFSVKGLAAGAGMLVLAIVTGLTGARLVEIIAWILMIPAIASFLTMNFTGSSTYTSLSGVRKEMRTAVPLQITGSATGLVLWILSRFI